MFMKTFFILKATIVSITQRFFKQFLSLESVLNFYKNIPCTFLYTTYLSMVTKLCHVNVLFICENGKKSQGTNLINTLFTAASQRCLS